MIWRRGRPRVLDTKSWLLLPSLSLHPHRSRLRRLHMRPHVNRGRLLPMLLNADPSLPPRGVSPPGQLSQLSLCNLSADRSSPRDRANPLPRLIRPVRNGRSGWLRYPRNRRDLREADLEHRKSRRLPWQVLLLDQNRRRRSRLSLQERPSSYPGRRS